MVDQLAKLQRTYVLEADVSVNVPAPYSNNALQFDYDKQHLTCHFDIMHSVSDMSGKATITLVNLNETHRKLLWQDGYDPDKSKFRGIKFSCGYKNLGGEMVPLIFEGNITSCHTTREHTEYHTVFECYEYSNNTRDTFISAQYDPDTLLGQTGIYKKLIQNFTDIDRMYLSLFDSKPTVRGPVFFGNIRDHLAEISNHRFHVNNGVAFILKDGEVIPGEVLEINTASGLLGSPRRSGAYVECDMLFEPRIQCDQQIKLTSTTNPLFNTGTLEGNFGVYSVRHRGTISEAESGDCMTTVALKAGGFFTPAGYVSSVSGD